MITIQNNFHNTSTTIRKAGRISESQERRIRKALCGVSGCTCGGALGERGPQSCEIDYDSDGRVLVFEMVAR